MKFKVLLPSPRGGSRLTETIGVNEKSIVLNRVMAARMKVGPDSMLGLAVTEDGFLAMSVAKPGTPTAFRITRPSSARGARFCSPGRGIMSRLEKGRFGITGEEGGFFIMGCRYVGSDEERCAPQEAEDPEEKHRGRPARSGMRTPPDGWPGGGRLRCL